MTRVQTRSDHTIAFRQEGQMPGNQRAGHAKAYSSVIDVAVGSLGGTRGAGALWPMNASLSLERLPIFLRLVSYSSTKYPPAQWMI